MTTDSKAKNRQQLELTVLGFLVGLIIKTVLDSVFKDSFDNPAGIYAIWKSLYTCNILAFLVFFFALLRFLFDAWRFHEESKDDYTSIGKVWNLCMMLGVFLVFYAAGLTIKAHTLLSFYELFALAHFVDLIWFAPFVLIALYKRFFKNKNCNIKCLFGRPSTLTNRAVAKFVLLDIFTLLFFASSYWQWEFPGAQKAAGSGMILIGILDLIWNRQFYFIKQQSLEHPV